MPKLPHDKNSCQIKGCPYHDTVVRKLVDQIRENQKSMPKLPQHIEVLFDKEFWDSNLNRVTVHDRDPDDIKSFIATIVEEERMKAFLLGYKYGDRVQIKWEWLYKEEQDKLINLIKEDEKNNL